MIVPSIVSDFFNRRAVKSDLAAHRGGHRRTASRERAQRQQQYEGNCRRAGRACLDSWQRFRHGFVAVSCGVGLVEIEVHGFVHPGDTTVGQAEIRAADVVASEGHPKGASWPDSVGWV